MNTLILAATAEPTVVQNGWSDPSNWVAALITLAVTGGLAYLLRRLIMRWSHRAESVASTVQISAQITSAVIVIIGIATALGFLGVNLAPLIASLGVAGVAAGFALKDIAENYASGVIMGFSNPFQPGDRVIVASPRVEGTVEELQLRYTVIRSSDGVRILMPNAQVLKNPIENISANATRRSTFDIDVAFDTDLDKVRQLASAAVSGVDRAHHQPDPEVFAVEMDDEWMTLRVHFWHEPLSRERNLIRGDALAATLEALNNAKITMPYTSGADGKN